MTDNINGQPHDRTALILYGSETGNSQDAAEQLGRITERLRFMTKVVEMNAVELNQLPEHTCVIFIISTTGQGDIPANARKFWKSLLRKRLAADCLSKLCFTTFGLGDSSYVKYNWAARKLHKRVEQLGGQEIYPRGEADEQHEEGIDGVFLPWSLGLRSYLLVRYPLPEGILPIPDTELLPPKWTLEPAETSRTTGNSPRASESNRLSTSENLAVMDGPITNDSCLKEAAPKGAAESTDKELPPDDLLAIPGSLTATVGYNTRLTPLDHWQDVRHITLDIDQTVVYRPGDIVTIYPKNFPEDVDYLIKLMDWGADADKPLTFQTTTPSYNDPTFVPMLAHLCTTEVATLRSLLIHNLDITAIPRRSFFELISKFTDDPLHRDRLIDFTNPAYSDEFFDYTTRPRRSILEVLHDFPTVRLPWRWACHIFPTLRGRQFSIASGGHYKHPDHNSTHLEICVAIVKYRTVLKKIRQGVCSRYLASLPAGTRLNITFNGGTFRYGPQQNKRPLLMIAPGTGIAPMRSLIWERASWLESGEHAKLAEAVLIFGCRSRSKDFLYHQDWKLKELDLKVFTAFSRDQREKIYVQDVVREQAEMVYKMLVEDEGTVFVCGSSGKMPVAVRAALVDAFFEGARRLNWSYTRESAEEALSAMQKEGRYVQETW